MTSFTLHTAESAPSQSKPILQAIQKGYGFIPNLMAQLAESPVTFKALVALSDAFDASTLTPAEQQAVLLAVSVENACDFCTSAHSFVARKVVRMNPADIDALRSGTELPSQRLDAIAQFARKLVAQRGRLDDGDVAAFLGQGFTKAQLLEVILGVAYKTLSNYSSHVLHTPVNEQFKDEAPASQPA